MSRDSQGQHRQDQRQQPAAKSPTVDGTHSGEHWENERPAYEFNQPGGIADAFASVFGIPSRSKKESADHLEPSVPEDPGSRSASWQAGLRKVRKQYPEEFGKTLAAYPEWTFVIRQIHADGTFTGECRSGRSVFHVFIRQPGCEPLCGCHCDASQGEHPCAHSLGFLRHVIRMLRSEFSPVRRIVDEGRFAQYAFDPYGFKTEIMAALLELLDGIDVPDPGYPSGDDGALPQVDDRPTRVAWNIKRIGSNSVKVVPIIQQAKLRGDGWTKGSEIQPSGIHGHWDVLSPQDRCVGSILDEVGGDQYGHASDLEYYTCDMLCELVGAPNVLVERETATVGLFDAALTVHTQGNFCHIGLADGAAGDMVVLTDEDTIVAINFAARTVRTHHMPEDLVSVLSALIALPPMPLEMRPHLIDKLASLQHCLNIRFPDDVARREIPLDCGLVMVLRYRGDGTLDYGLRVRISEGKLARPGQGSLRLNTTLDDEHVQFVRDPELERRSADRLLIRLNLPRDDYDGTVTDFEQALGLLERLQSLEVEGVETLWDKSSAQAVKMLGTITRGNVRVDVAAKRDWFQMTGNCAFDRESIELQALLDSLDDVYLGEGSDYINIRDFGWARISRQLRDQLAKLRGAVHRERQTLKFDATSAAVVRELRDAEVAVEADEAWHACLARLDRAERLEPVLPAGLNAELREYQVSGYQWLRRLAEWGVGGVLADDMGLGKTVQTLAVVLDREAEGPALVIAPTSVAFNWQREAEKFTPGLCVHSYRETDRGAFLEAVGAGDLVICSYGLALRDADKLASVRWATLVLDEAQAIKNSRSKTSRAIATIPADWRLALTGTPVENHLGELWSLFHVISPGVFGSWQQFRQMYAGPIEREDDQQCKQALRARLAPFLLRRTKAEVLQDLPPRTETNVLVDLTPAERTAYEAVRQAALGEINAIAALPEIQDQRFRILALVTRLRQLACSPALVRDDWVQRSAKLTTLLDHVSELRDEGHRVLIFSQFVQQLQLVRQMFDEERISYEYLDGATPAAERQQCVDRFQNGDASAFLISLKAGGTGLNLTAADYVIHMDPWWNPAVEDQATDRAHRIGQDRPVMVYRLIARGTIEEEILKLHDSKRDLVEGIMAGTNAAAKLSTEELIELLRGPQS